MTGKYGHVVVNQGSVCPWLFCGRCEWTEDLPVPSNARDLALRILQFIAEHSKEKCEKR